MACFSPISTLRRSVFPQRMNAAVNLDLRRGTRLGAFASSHPAWFVGGIFAALLILQALGRGLLGTGRAGMGLSECILLLDNILALVCAGIAFRRAQGIITLYWFLFAVVLVVLLVPTAIQTYDTVFERSTLSESTRALIYCLYGAPILMMLFLPDTLGRTRVRSEIFLDFFQVAIVVSLIYATFFFLPAQHMLPADALHRNVSVSDGQSLLLLIAGLVRLQFSRAAATRDLSLRLTIFLAVCAIATFTGDWVDVHYHLYWPWFDLGWAIPTVVAGIIAFTWTPAPEPISTPVPANFLSFLGTNLVLVAMLSGIALLRDHWKQAYGGTFTNLAIAASLLAFALRLALTQFHQHKEIAQRRSAQEQLAASHQKVARLLNNAQQQTAEITLISQLGNLLQACTSRAGIFALIPERMERIFPGTSGALSLLDASRTRAESVAHWGLYPPLDETFGGGSSHSSAASISAPLIANDEAFGVLVLRDDVQPSGTPSLSHSNELIRRRQVASALAEQIALTISNLDLREALHAEATRDPLTGLYNRRYMEEFLEREISRARRRKLPLSLMMIDIDHFKRYNDTFGHGAGDDALRLVGESLVRAVRTEDLVCRYGGEEFIVILPECALPQAAVRAETVRTVLRDLYADRPGELPDVVTVSIGVAAFQETTNWPDRLFEFADQALYQAKHEGRDRVVVARPENDRTAPPSQLEDHPVAAATETSLRS